MHLVGLLRPPMNSVPSSLMATGRGQAQWHTVDVAVQTHIGAGTDQRGVRGGFPVSATAMRSPFEAMSHWMIELGSGDHPLTQNACDNVASSPKTDTRWCAASSRTMAPSGVMSMPTNCAPSFCAKGQGVMIVHRGNVQALCITHDDAMFIVCGNRANVASLSRPCIVCG